MKKCLLFLAITMFSATASAQFTVWEDDFNDGEASDWTLLDLDGNTSNWFPRTDVQLDATGTVVVDGTQNILGTYNVSFIDLQFLGTGENNWAISPPIDLSYYGDLSLVLNAQTTIYNNNLPVDVMVYASTSPQQSTFTQVGTITINRLSMLELEFMDYSVELSQYSGQPEVYLALVENKTNGFIGVEINNVKIDANEILNVTNPDKFSSHSSITQNPVSENLKIQINPYFTAEALNVKIYTITGMLVKEVKFDATGMSINDLSSGMYIAVLNDGNTTETLKFIKK